MSLHVTNRHFIRGLVGLTLGTASCGPTGEDFSQSVPAPRATGAAGQGGDATGVKSDQHQDEFGEPFPFYTSSGGPLAVVARPEIVVWAESDRIQFCPAAGCGDDPAVRITESSLSEAPLPNTLAADGSRAYWLASGPDGPAARSCRFTQCSGAPETVLDAFSGPFFKGLVVADGTLYAFNEFGAFGCPASGCNRTPTRLFGVYDSGKFFMTADATGLYMGLDGEAHGTFHCAFGSCPPSLFAPLVTTVGQVAASDGNLYVLASTTIETCPVTGCGDAPTALASDQSNVTAMAADSSGVYWTVGGEDGSVLRCSLPRCAGGPVTVASGQANPVSVSVNDGYVYWANAGGSLMAAKKL